MTSGQGDMTKRYYVALLQKTLKKEVSEREDKSDDEILVNSVVLDSITLSLPFAL